MKPIWIVDDDPSIRFVLEKALAREQLPVRSFATTREVLAALETDEPQVLVSDIRMPGEDGYSLIQRIRSQSGASQGLPAVALTGLAHPEDRRRALTAGYQSFVPKPVEVSELANVIRRIARKH